MQSMSLRLPEPMFKEVVERAKANAVSQTEVIRDALTLYLKMPAEEAPKPLSAYEAGKKWIGICKDGPSDLSTNPLHMEDFGK
jgi:Arc/MetJ-type ribon-helix-helix transcriptional regulator